LTWPARPGSPRTLSAGKWFPVFRGVKTNEDRNLVSMDRFN
jgi:hypothetical protein